MTRIFVIVVTAVFGFLYGAFESGLLSLEDVPLWARLDLAPLPFTDIYTSNYYWMLNVPHKYECRTQLHVEIAKKRFPVGTKTTKLLSTIGRADKVIPYYNEKWPESWYYSTLDAYLEIKDGSVIDVSHLHFH